MWLGKKSIAFGAVALIAIAGFIFTVVLSVRTGKLETSNAELQQELLASIRQIELSKADFATQVADLERRRSEEVKKLEASVQALGNAPTPEDIAKVVMSEGADELVKRVATALANDPVTADALRGNDAQPGDVAKVIVEGEWYSALLEGLAKEIWETRRRNVLSDPELIATVAAKVYDEYGPELFEEIDAEKQALIIASELAREPGFAALVAAAKEQ